MQLQSWLAANPTKLPAAAAAHLTSANIAQANCKFDHHYQTKLPALSKMRKQVGQTIVYVYVYQL